MSADIDEYPSLRFQDIRKKPVSWTDNVKTVYPPDKQSLREV